MTHSMYPSQPYLPATGQPAERADYVDPEATQRIPREMIDAAGHVATGPVISGSVGYEDFGPLGHQAEQQGEHSTPERYGKERALVAPNLIDQGQRIQPEDSTSKPWPERPRLINQHSGTPRWRQTTHHEGHGGGFVIFPGGDV